MKLIIDIPEELKQKIDAGFINQVIVNKLWDATRNGILLDNIRTEIEKAVWEDVVISLDEADEVKIPRLDPDDVFEIIDKYKAEREPQESEDEYGISH